MAKARTSPSAAVAFTVQASREAVHMRQALAIADALLRALDHAHAATDARGRKLGLVHRDVTPANLLVSIDGDVKLRQALLAACAPVAPASPAELAAWVKAAQADVAVAPTTVEVATLPAMPVRE